MVVFKVGDRVRFKEPTYIRNIDVQSMDWTAQPDEEYVVTKAAGSYLVISPSKPPRCDLYGTFRGENEDGQSVLELVAIS